jgi:hypothetical protein
VGADIDRRIAGPQETKRQAHLVRLVAAANDVQADDVIGEVDEQSHAALELLDHDGAVVRVRVVSVLLLKLGRGHQMSAEFLRVARAREFGTNRVLAFRIAIE